MGERLQGAAGKRTWLLDSKKKKKIPKLYQLRLSEAQSLYNPNHLSHSLPPCVDNIDFSLPLMICPLFFFK